jgi:hypothetical protein
MMRSQGREADANYPSSHINSSLPIPHSSRQLSCYAFNLRLLKHIVMTTFDLDDTEGRRYYSFPTELFVKKSGYRPKTAPKKHNPTVIWLRSILLSYKIQLITDVPP